METALQFILAEQARRLAAKGRLRESAALLEPLVNQAGNEVAGSELRGAVAVPLSSGEAVRPEVLDLAARVHFRLGDMKMALNFWERACRMDPSNEAYARSLHRCERAMKPGFGGLSARTALAPVFAAALVLCAGVGGWLGVQARDRRLVPPAPPPSADARPTPAETLRYGVAQAMGLLPDGPAYEVFVDDTCTIKVTGMSQSLAERYEMEQTLAALPGALVVDVSGVHVAASCLVEPGDTLWSLAARFLDSPYRWEELAEVNGLKPPYAIRPGDRLKLP